MILLNFELSIVSSLAEERNQISQDKCHHIPHSTDKKKFTKCIANFYKLKLFFCLYFRDIRYSLIHFDILHSFDINRNGYTQYESMVCLYQNLANRIDYDDIDTKSLHSLLLIQSASTLYFFHISKALLWKSSFKYFTYQFKGGEKL